MAVDSGCKGVRGFTIIELIVIIAILAVVAVVASPRLDDLPETRAEFAARQLRSDIRYTQQVALQSQSQTRFSASQGLHLYWIEIESSPGNWTYLPHPATRQTYQVPLDFGDFKGVLFTRLEDGFSPSGALAVRFDRFGAPLDASGNPMGQEAVLELNGKYQLGLSPETGHIELRRL